MQCSVHFADAICAGYAEAKIEPRGVVNVILDAICAGYAEAKALGYWVSVLDDEMQSARDAPRQSGKVFILPASRCGLYRDSA